MSDVHEKGSDLWAFAACIGKETFASRALAMVVEKRLNRGKARGRHAYRCEHCRMWHIGAASRFDARTAAAAKQKRDSHA
jgi:hypothetical protein